MWLQEMCSFVVLSVLKPSACTVQVLCMVIVSRSQLPRVLLYLAIMAVSSSMAWSQ